MSNQLNEPLLIKNIQQNKENLNENYENTLDLNKIKYNEHKYSNISVEESANIIDKAIFQWTSKIVNYGNKKCFENKDLFEIRKDEKYKFSSQNLELNYSQNKNLYLSLFYLVWRPLLVSFILLITGSLLQYAGPLLMKKILIYLQMEQTYPLIYPYLLAAIFFIIFFTRVFVIQHAYHKLNAVSFRVLISLQYLIFKKSLVMSSFSKKFFDQGKTINLATVDAIGIYQFIYFSESIMTAPFMTGIGIYFIINEIGCYGLLGVLVILLSMALNVLISRKQINIRKESMFFTDKRSKMISEILAGIRLIKYYAWEKYFMKQLSDIREQETRKMLKSQIYNSLQALVSNVNPVLITIVVFAAYVKSGNNLTPQIAFTILAYFELVTQPIQTLASMFPQIVNCVVSFKRINLYSKCSEKVLFSHEEMMSNKKNIVKYFQQPGTIIISNASFAWETSESKQHAEQFMKLQYQKKQEKQFDLLKSPPEIFTNRKQSFLSDQRVNSQSSFQTDLKNKLNEYYPISPALENINLKVSQGEFICIVGQIGQGKTSLFYAILQELHMITGIVNVEGSIAYVGQTPFLINATIRENILFGLPFNQSKYQKALQICELEQDLQVMNSGDFTEIGEKGLNLSGGQKQRIQLARAYYSNADIFLIDDALASLDQYVGKRIFQNLILNNLKNKRKKTILFITHAIHFAKQADRVLIMKNGQIIEDNTPFEIQQNENSEFNKLAVVLESQKENSISKKQKNNQVLKQLESTPTIKHKIKKNFKQLKKFNFQSKDSNEEDNKIIKNKSSRDRISTFNLNDMEKGKLVMAEKKEIGAIPMSTYISYLTNGGNLFIIFLLSCLVLEQFFCVGNQLWLSAWSTNKFQLDIDQNIVIYASFGIGMGIIIFIKYIIFGYFAKNTANSLQNKMISSIMHSPIQWFDQMPSGRILSRTNQDQSDVDTILGPYLLLTSQLILHLIQVLITIIVILPIFLVVVIISMHFFWKQLVKYLTACREIKRLNVNNRTPILSLISEASNGQIYFRTYSYSYRKIFEKFENKFDCYLRANSNVFSCNRYNAVRTEMITSILLTTTIFLVIISQQIGWIKNVGLMGLCIQQMLGFTTQMTIAIKKIGGTELQMNAMERILEFINKNEKEKDWDQPLAPLGWPFKGEIEIQNISFKYRDDMPIVLKNISFNIQSGQKIGIIGRTGSGKSTLSLGILRILELYKQNNNQVNSFIKIDDIDISKIGLHQIRKNIAIIPQDPILFSGTLKNNIDPNNEFSSFEIIQSLKKAQIWSQIKQKLSFLEQENYLDIQQNYLDQIYVENENQDSNDFLSNIQILYTFIKDTEMFSLGQRQLICIARALLRKPKILLMDEATASIDEFTDNQIQQMIKNEFKEATVLTIAHRLNTIIQYDKIMILKNGKIIEFAEPSILINDSSSYLFSLINECGEEYENKLKQLLQQKVQNSQL